LVFSSAAATMLRSPDPPEWKVTTLRVTAIVLPHSTR